MQPRHGLLVVLAILVMGIISGRFNEQMKKLRTEVAVIYDTDVSRSSASMTVSFSHWLTLICAASAAAFTRA